MSGASHSMLLNHWFPAAPPNGAVAKPVRAAGLIGIGSLGTGIAHWCATKGMGVILHDAEPAALSQAVGMIRENFRAAEERHEITHAAAHKAVGGIGITTSIEDLEFCDIIIETLVEDVGSKRARLAALSQALPKDIVLATAASAPGLEELFGSVAEPGRLIGLGFLEPVHATPQVRITVGTQTTRVTAERVLALAAVLGKAPIVHGPPRADA